MMEKEEWIKARMLQKTGVEMDFKLEWDAFRFQICEKMFGMLTYNKQAVPVLTLKLPPQEGAWYREQYDFICEGYYMNKVHWISICYELAEEALLEELMEKSYDNFIHQLTKKQQAYIKELS